MVLTFVSVDEILKCDYANEMSLAILLTSLLSVFLICLRVEV